jgi:hypothetical protein
LVWLLPVGIIAVVIEFILFSGYLKISIEDSVGDIKEELAK